MPGTTTGRDARKSKPPQTTQLPAWKALEAHHHIFQDLHLRQLFAEDPGRGERLALEAAGVYLDYSKHLVTDETIKLLVYLAEGAGLKARIGAMFRGDKVNVTEGRPALHVALRAPRDRSILADGKDVVPGVHAALDRMAAFSERVRAGRCLGHTGKPLRHIVNIGIGGSDLGPVMAYEALRHYARPDLSFRFVSNVDGTDFVEAVRGLDPAETLFIVASRTFADPETMANARSAREWALAALQETAAAAKHFVAVTADARKAAEFGIDPENVFEFWDWVGGRHSLASAVGLSTMIAVGPDDFRAMLGGFHEMDEHFRTAPFARNLPVLMGLLGLWYNEFFGAQTWAVLPYEQYLKRFPAYLQGLAMESGGKGVALDGSPVSCQTGAVCWGEPGTNGQHSFSQLLHQGTKLIPCDFIGFVEPLNPLGRHHERLLANLLAQTAVLAFGRTAQEAGAGGAPPALAPHLSLPGNRPSSTILMERLTPAALGKLVALYEHSVFTQAAVWQIDPFDRSGGQPGKTLAESILPELESADEPALAHDSSTNTLIRRCRKPRPG